jgi:hypothetical protein
MPTPEKSMLEKTRPRRSRGPVEVRDQTQYVLKMLDAGLSKRVAVYHGDALGQIGNAG